MRILKSDAFIVLLIVVWGSGVIGCKSSENDYVPPPPPDVTVSQPLQRLITPFLEENGVIEAVDEADVRARVRGFVESVEFKAGQEVTRGDVLYKIESTQYQASVNSATAEVAAAEAAISVANAVVKTAEAKARKTDKDFERAKQLLSQNAGSQAEFDTATAENEAALAALESAKANVEAALAAKGQSVASLAQAQLDLDYTTVQAPIRGRISPTDIKQGNLVEDGAKLAAVVNRSQVFANFSISDRDLLRFMKEKKADLQAGEKPAETDWGTTKVFLQREFDAGFPFEGVLEYVDQQGVDAGTGTLRLRAQFDNRDDSLLPGLFVMVRMPGGNSVESMLIPEYAVLRDQQGHYVLVVNAKRKVERVGVTVGETISGWTVIEKGLALESRVVVDGIQRARPGLEVNPIDKKLEVDEQTLLRGFSPADDLPDVATDVSATSPSEVD
ncbi:Efflux pump periplasmic linker BepF [Planctomycetes bacterium CA13]|uniref:Efflux pump periplasmic linker BepF n=1 Tax=Novipirellula herctigrandis TaxID=2527986 RepID=A0A5C5YV79_9BACT|nr:Efflux pump periplasmic linker BepF [Planctomycetes bacterium CA13]